MPDNDFPTENLVPLHARWVAGFRLQHQPEQAMRNPQPFTVIQNGKPIFTVHAYSLARPAALSRPRSRARPSLSPSRATVSLKRSKP